MHLNNYGPLHNFKLELPEIYNIRFHIALHTSECYVHECMYI